MPLNAFARELLVRLGLGVCQFNPNVWRLVISMQILWREVFGGDCPLTVDEFLYCYKPSEINQSNGFYQFTARGNDCRLIKSLASSDKNWKTEFIFISGFLGREPCGHWQGSFCSLHWGLREPSSSRYVPPLYFSLFISFLVCTSNFCLPIVLQLLNVRL